MMTTTITSTTISSQITEILMKKSPQVMLLKILVLPSINNDRSLYEYYVKAVEKHNQKILCNEYMDAGFDLCIPPNGLEKCVFNPSLVNKVDFGVQMAAFLFSEDGKVFPTGYTMYPRSSLSNTKVRLANSVGVIDAGYRGNIIGKFDVSNSCPYRSNLEEIPCFDRIVQICAPNFSPILVELVHRAEELSGPTERGSGGFGSTNDVK